MCKSVYWIMDWKDREEVLNQEGDPPQNKKKKTMATLSNTPKKGLVGMPLEH